MKAVMHHMGGSGPPVVMIHGFGADRMTWMFLGPMLTERFGVYVLDLPGHGDSSNEVGDGSIAALADSVEAVLPERPVRIVGHSMGGAVALELARRGVVSHSALIAPAGLGSKVERRFLDEFPEIRDAEDAGRVLGLLVSKQRLVTPQMADYVLKGLSKEGRREALRRVANGLMAVNPTIPTGSPCTVVWGQVDEVNMPPTEPPVADYHMLDGVGHMPHMEAASRVSAIVLKALQT